MRNGSGERASVRRITPYMAEPHTKNSPSGDFKPIIWSNAYSK